MLVCAVYAVRADTPRDNVSGDAGHVGDVHAVALGADAAGQLVQESDLATVVVDDAAHVVESDGRGPRELVAQHVVVRGKQRAALHGGHQVPQHRIRNCVPVKRARPPPKLVQDHQRPLSGVVQDVGRLLQLNLDGKRGE